MSVGEFNEFVAYTDESIIFLAVPPRSLKKKNGARQFNDVRPVALTSIIAKCMESRLTVCNQLIVYAVDRKVSVGEYRTKRDVEDATFHSLISSHLDHFGTNCSC